MDIILKTERAKSAASELGLFRTSASLERLRRSLLMFKDLPEAERPAGARTVATQVERAKAAYKKDAEGCGDRICERFSIHMGKTFAFSLFISLMSIGSLVLGSLEALARDSRLALTMHAAFTVATIAASFIALPLLQAASFRRMVSDNARMIHEAMDECWTIASEYLHPSSPS